MPLEALMDKWKSGAPMSNGQHVQSQKQAVAIAASEGYLGKKAKAKSKKKKRREHPLVAAMMKNPAKG